MFENWQKLVSTKRNNCSVLDNILITKPTPFYSKPQQILTSQNYVFAPTRVICDASNKNHLFYDVLTHL